MEFVSSKLKMIEILSPCSHYTIRWSRLFLMSLAFGSALGKQPHDSQPVQSESLSVMPYKAREEICATELNTPFLYYNSVKNDACRKGVGLANQSGLPKSEIIEFFRRNDEFKNHGIYIMEHAIVNFRYFQPATANKIMKEIRTRKELDHILKSTLLKKIYEFESAYWWSVIVQDTFLNVFNVFDVLEALLADRNHSLFLTFYYNWASLLGFNKQKICGTQVAMSLFTFLVPYNDNKNFGKKLEDADISAIFNFACDPKYGWNIQNISVVLSTPGLKQLSTNIFKVILERVASNFQEIQTSPRDLPEGLSLQRLFSDLGKCQPYDGVRVDYRYMTSCVEETFKEVRKSIQKVSKPANEKDLIVFVNNGFIKRQELDDIRRTIKDLAFTVSDDEVFSVLNTLYTRKVELVIGNDWTVKEYLMATLDAWKGKGYDLHKTTDAVIQFPRSKMPPPSFRNLISKHTTKTNDEKNLVLDVLSFAGKHFSSIYYSLALDRAFVECLDTCFEIASKDQSMLVATGTDSIVNFISRSSNIDFVNWLLKNKLNGMSKTSSAGQQSQLPNECNALKQYINMGLLSQSSLESLCTKLMNADIAIDNAAAALYTIYQYRDSFKAWQIEDYVMEALTTQKLGYSQWSALVALSYFSSTNLSRAVFSRFIKAHAGYVVEHSGYCSNNITINVLCFVGQYEGFSSFSFTDSEIDAYLSYCYQIALHNDGCSLNEATKESFKTILLKSQNVVQLNYAMEDLAKRS